MTPVGGQAVLEGVMMRTPRFWAVSVRRPDGRISNVVRTAASPAARNRLLRLPIVRGVFALGDSMAIGFRALSLSAQYAATDEDAAEGEAADELPRSAIIGAFAIAIAFGVGLFKWTPGIMARLLGLEKGVWFVLVEGGIKVALLVAYLAALNLVPDLKRVFQYHAAEHMAINALEAGDELTVENVRRHSRIHVRCGTAFLLWVMLVSIVVFLFVTPDGWIPLLVSRIALLPLIAGIAYEVIRFAGRFGTNPVVHAVLAPGLWLQRLTTRPPSDDQLEVSIDALRHVLQEERQGGGQPRVEVMA